MTTNTPMLEVDGRCYTQSVAIYKLVARHGGLYPGDDPLRDVPARCPDVARPDAPSSGTRSGDRSWKHATVLPPMHRTGEAGPVLSFRAPIALEPTRRRTCRAVELWSPEPRSQNARRGLLLHKVRKRGGFHLECSYR